MGPTPARSVGAIRLARRLALLAAVVTALRLVVQRRPTRGHPWFACFYDGLARIAERGELGRRRQEIVGGASGMVLDLGSGTGENFKHYRTGVDAVIATEPDPHMRRRGRRRSLRGGTPVRHVAAAGEHLPFRDGAFGTAVATLVFCSVDDPDAAARELRRVRAPDGELRVLEHVRAASATLAAWQDRLERPWGTMAGGCHPNRDTRGVLDAAGFDVGNVTPFVLTPSIPLVAPHIKGTATPR